jgi:hypothetical protein
VWSPRVPAISPRAASRPALDGHRAPCVDESGSAGWGGPNPRRDVASGCLTAEFVDRPQLSMPRLPRGRRVGESSGHAGDDLTNFLGRGAVDDRPRARQRLPTNRVARAVDSHCRRSRRTNEPPPARGRRRIPYPRSPRLSGLSAAGQTLHDRMGAWTNPAFVRARHTMTSGDRSRGMWLGRSSKRPAGRRHEIVRRHFGCAGPSSHVAAVRHMCRRTASSRAWHESARQTPGAYRLRPTSRSNWRVTEVLCRYMSFRITRLPYAEGPLFAASISPMIRAVRYISDRRLRRRATDASDAVVAVPSQRTYCRSRMSSTAVARIRVRRRQIRSALRCRSRVRDGCGLGVGSPTARPAHTAQTWTVMSLTGSALCTCTATRAHSQGGCRRPRIQPWSPSDLRACSRR